MPRPRSVHMRTAALAGVVGLCLVVPLAAASADSSDRSGTAKSGPTAPPPVKNVEFGDGVAGPEANPVQSLLGGSGAPSGKAAASASASAPAAAGPAAECGRSTEAGGVRAQTCVERVGDEVRGRVYYANATAQKALLVLNVLQPGGGSVAVRCTVPANAADGQCETPLMKAPGGVTGWSAVAEFATADGLAKILRSGTER